MRNKTLCPAPKRRLILWVISVLLQEMKLTVAWHLRTVLTAAAQWKKQAVAEWAEDEAPRAKSTPGIQVLQAFENILENGLPLLPPKGKLSFEAIKVIA